MIAGTEEEQVRALSPLLERFSIENVLWSGSENESASGWELRQTLVTAHTRLIMVQPGQALDLGEGAALQVLAAGKRGSVLPLEWRDFRIE